MISDEERWAQWMQTERLAGRAAGIVAKGFAIGFLGTIAAAVGVTLLLILGLLVVLIVAAL